MSIVFVLSILLCLSTIMLLFSLHVKKTNAQPISLQIEKVNENVDLKITARGKTKMNLTRKHCLLKYNARNKGKAIMKARRQGHIRAAYHGEYYPTGLYITTGSILNNGRK